MSETEKKAMAQEELDLIKTDHYLNQFWKRVDKSNIDGCWLWTGSFQRYGIFHVSRKYQPRRAHRVSWMIHYGLIPKNMLVCHKCDNPPCVNPTHLFLGSITDNHRDMEIKGRIARGNKHGNSKITEQDVREIRQLSTAGIRGSAIAKQFGLTKENVNLIIARKAWRHVA